MTEEKKRSLKEFLEAVTPKPYVLQLPNAGPMVIKHLSYRDSGALHQMVFDKKIETDPEIVAHYLERVARAQLDDGTEGLPPDPRNIGQEDLRIFADAALKNDERVSNATGDPIAELANRMREHWKKDDERAEQLVKNATDWVSPLTRSLLTQADQANDFVQNLIRPGAAQTIGVAGIVPGEIGLPGIFEPLPPKLNIPEFDTANFVGNRTAKAAEDLLIVAQDNLQLGRGVAQQISSMYALARSWNADLAKRQGIDMRRRTQDEKSVRRSITIAAVSLVVSVGIGAGACVLAYKTLVVTQDTLADARDSGRKSQDASSDAQRSADRMHDDLQALLQSFTESRTELKQSIRDFITATQQKPRPGPKPNAEMPNPK